MRKARARAKRFSALQEVLSEYAGKDRMKGYFN